MLRSLNQNNILSQEFGKISFITLGNNFRWIIKTGNITGYGFSENNYFVGNFINNNSIQNESIFTGIKLTVHYKATQYRNPVSTERTFTFSNYLKSNTLKVPIPDDLRISIIGNNYMWRSINFSEGWMVDEELLNREMNIWLITMTSS